jgi:hypothetical protein
MARSRPPATVSSVVFAPVTGSSARGRVGLTPLAMVVDGPGVVVVVTVGAVVVGIVVEEVDDDVVEDEVVDDEVVDDDDVVVPVSTS